MSFKVRFLEPEDLGDSPCCLGCKETVCPLDKLILKASCPIIKKLIEYNNKAIRDLEIKTGYPIKE